jgi:tetratricopeptide (TPR) repeat protein
MRFGLCSLMVSVLSVSFVFSQTSDEVRTSSGLPTPIAGSRASQNPQLGIEVSGVLLVEGEGAPTEPPDFLIYVVSQSNNSFVFGRQKIKNRGSFRVEAVPTALATLVLEVNGAEFARYPLNMGGSPIVRQDISLTWKQIGERLAKAAVIDARKFYQRSAQNQKLFDKAMAEKNNKKSDAAIKLFKEAVNADAKDFISWTELGNLYFENKPKEADEAYQKALESKPDYFFALLNYGKLQVAQKNYEPAIELLTKAAAAEPPSADANHYLGEAYLGAKKGSKAVGFLNEAIRLSPIEKAEIHLRLAALYNGANLKDRAVAEYKQFLAKVPDHPEKKKLEQYISDNSPK